MKKQDKQYFIRSDGQYIPVTEEVYKAYYRPIWREPTTTPVKTDNVDAPIGVNAPATAVSVVTVPQATLCRLMRSTKVKKVQS